MLPPACWDCGGQAVLPSPAADAPPNELFCSNCRSYFLGTSDEVTQAHRRKRLRFSSAGEIERR
jgi:hypothetical protein